MLALAPSEHSTASIVPEGEGDSEGEGEGEGEGDSEGEGEGQVGGRVRARVRVLVAHGHRCRAEHVDQGGRAAAVQRTWFGLGVRG